MVSFSWVKGFRVFDRGWWVLRCFKRLGLEGLENMFF